MTFREEIAADPAAILDSLAEMRRRWPASIFNFRGSVGIACTQEEIERIGRLRYDLFIARDKKRYGFANHKARTFLEPVDRYSLNFRVRAGDEIISAVRLTRAIDALECPHLASLVDNTELTLEELGDCVINSRMVVSEHPDARLRVASLFRLVYRAGMLSDARQCLIATRPSLQGLFERFGFISRSWTYVDPVGGEMAVMLLNLRDRDHLDRTRSPLLKIYDELTARPLLKEIA